MPKKNTKEKPEANTAPNAVPTTINIINTPAAQAKSNTGSKVAKIILSVLVIGSLALLGFSAFLAIRDSAVGTSTDESYLTLNGKNISDSKKEYAKFGNAKEGKGADFAFVGTKLYYSESKITANSIDGSNYTAFTGTDKADFILYNIDSNISVSNTLKTDIASQKYYIDLAEAPEGDYLIYAAAAITNSGDTSSINPYSLKTASSINYSFYTLPDQAGNRKRITFRNNSVSPYTLITVKDCGSTLPYGYYDAVIYNAEYVKDNDTRDYKEEIKSVSKSTSGYQLAYASSLKEAANINAPVAIAFTDGLEKDMTSIFNASAEYSTKIFAAEDSNELTGYDYYPEIRELTGYLDKAGENYSNVTANDTVYTSDSRLGKESYILNFESADEAAAKITALLA